MIQINKENVDKKLLLTYLQKTPLSKEIEIENYADKVFKYATIFVARQDNNIIGINIVYFNDYENKRGYITYIYLNEDYRGQGLGGRLLNTAIEYGRKCGFTSIALEVRKDNNKAKLLYEKNGFIIYQDVGKSYYMNKYLSL